MIKKWTIIKKAFCDVCGASLSTEGQENTDGTPLAAHRGRLLNDFGFGSPLDGVDDPTGNLDLCEACYRKCFEALGLTMKEGSGSLILESEMLLLENDQPYRRETGKEVYHARRWVCNACGWRNPVLGYRIPDHTCEGKKPSG